MIDVSLSLSYMYPNALMPEDISVSNNQIVYWNTQRLGPQPSSLQLARSWYDLSRGRAYGRMAIGMTLALRALVPEVSAVEGAEQIREAWLAILLVEVMRNNNPTRRQAVLNEVSKWTNLKAQVDAVTLSASPTESEYLSKADTLNAITY